VGVALTGIRRNREFFQNQRRELPGVWPLVSGLVSQPQLENRIDDAVDEAGEVRDSATPELADIRRRLRRLRNGLVEKLERLAAANPQWFNGPPTIRGDRFVLPLLLEQRNRVQGVIHGSSGSGQTLFVEPLDMVGEGNELQELRDAEAEEVARILRQLSRQVAEAEPNLAGAMEAAAGLDLVVAKRRFAARLDCRRPGISEDGVIEVVRGRHPLLLQRKVKVVPLDFRFPGRMRAARPWC
jgi:DNA mismatch repair protein MutS2